MPSNRTEEYMEEHRFSSKEEALEYFNKWLDIEKSINQSRYMLREWGSKYSSFKERPESEQNALMCVRRMEEWRECLLNNCEYIRYNNNEEKIYPKKLFYEHLNLVVENSRIEIIENLYDKMIKPINKKNINDEQ
jgi:hypothetical protein